jgi:alpha-tubulin suppressor-like RCC1 family protein
MKRKYFMGFDEKLIRNINKFVRKTKIKTGTKRKVTAACFLIFTGAVLMMAHQNCSGVRLGPANFLNLGSNSNSSGASTLPPDPPSTAVLGLGISNVAVGQGGELHFNISLANPNSTPVTVNYKTIGGTAVAGKEFVPATGSLVLGAGMNSATVTVSSLAQDFIFTLVDLKLELTGTRGTVTEVITGIGQILPVVESAPYKHIRMSGDYGCGILADDTVRCWNNSLPYTISGLATVRDLKVGAGNSCALTPQNTVKCWGKNYSGELGNGTKVASQTAVDVIGVSDVKAIAIGSNSACAVTNAGAAYCWGEGYQPTPSLVPGLPPIKSISIGAGFQCAVTLTDTVKCWSNRPFGNLYGSLGNNSTVDSPAPVDVAGLAGVNEIESGSKFTCALLLAGGVKCWGKDFNASEVSWVNSLVPVDVFTGAKSLSVGYDHACILTAQDTVKCLGIVRLNGTVTSPLDVPGLTEIQEISSSRSQYGEHVCGLTKLNSVRCYASPLEHDGRHLSMIPMHIAGPSLVKSFGNAGYTGSLHCIITDQNTVKCAGENKYGQLGDVQAAFSETFIDVPGLGTVKGISVGTYHACALTSTDTVKCWGKNQFGPLGNGTTVDSRIPVDVGLTGVKAVIAGAQHSCALLNNGSVSCWGANFSGQIGNGTAVNALTPVSVSGLSDVAIVSAGRGHTCAITTQNVLYCWGSNDYYQSGGPTMASITVPQIVPNVGLAKSVSAGDFTSCAVTVGGLVKCWGWNYRGQVGSGQAPDYFIGVLPGTTVPGLTGMKSVATGWGHSCAVTDQDKIKCWGDNAKGQFGIKAPNESLVPVDAFGADPISQLFISMDTTAVIFKSGLLRVSGRLFNGSLKTTDMVVPK